jgi:hypothetical protein
MAGGEVAERLASNAGAAPFIEHILATFPKRKVGEIRQIQRQFSNAFKHATTRNGEDRNDQEIISSFDPEVNNHTLFVGWHDFMLSGSPTPIEAQVFTAWYFARHPEKINPDVDMSPFEQIFPNLSSAKPRRQLHRLRDVIRKQKKNGAVMEDTRTDRRPLVLPWQS